MEENPENKAFGLEVICFNSENNPEQIQTSNYRYCVGSSLKPKLVRPGRILIKLRLGFCKLVLEAKIFYNACFGSFDTYLLYQYVVI